MYIIIRKIERISECSLLCIVLGRNYCVRNLRTFRWKDNDLKLYRFQLNLVRKNSTDRRESEIILCSFDVTASFDKCLLQVFDESLHTTKRSSQFEEHRFWIAVLDNNQAKSTKLLSFKNFV